ncbi:MAG: sigma-54-dependent Fis family transcriptional regulator [Sandaracinaceae bacterium]|nr:sigma-54-dependent Fis family transcriptional regulator [Sandaracinaceae bacterium]MBP7680277.1 sigma-54-dependent Fis family transcriptional regulator [Deltaproteobacteria bacterium]MBK7154912.1 sigma-54-dependent Fis family transcriptional regulator [Sandaracinaceae bacterium]MBK7772950.1 sigma-54-dependent Fis family transcriptional regulator [Sandaracinaceae bacterium]MBK8407161.1 sigma-54-dependent Fis family transcriptional regulator [Sandaracinaceae bacterium]
MNEIWHHDWLCAEGPLDMARYRGLELADALLEGGRLGDGLRLLEQETERSREAGVLRAGWLVRLGAVDEARSIGVLLNVLDGPDGPPTPPMRVQLALLAQRDGDTDAALLALEQAAQQLRAEGARWAATRVEVLEVTMRLVRRRASDLEVSAKVCQSLPGGSLQRLLLAWHHAASGAPVEALVQHASMLPQRMLGAEALAATVILARDQGNDEALSRAQAELLGQLETLGLTLPPRLRAGLFEGLGRGHARARARLVDARPSDERDRLARVFQTITRLARERELPRLLERITDGAVDLTGAERGFVLLAGAAGPTPEIERHAGGDLGAPGDATFSRSIAQSVILDARPIVTVDAQNDPRVRDFASVHQLALTSVACVPIRGRDGVLGALYLEHRSRRARFHADDLDLLLAFADQAAVALETHQALATLATQRDQLLAQRNELEAARGALEDALGRREVQLADTQRALAKVAEPFRTGYERFGIIGRSAALGAMLARVDRVRDVDLPIVLRGESGTGKELVARALHGSGRRRDRPFVALGCGALAASLLESELFGHVRGAFTGADRSRDGVFVRAEGGTLFLDELEDMPPKMQVDLLRVLQEGRVRPLGGDHDVHVDVRIVGATRRPLAECVAAGTFREDLFYRLQVVEIVVPPLRERLTDLPLLAAHLLAQLARERGDAPARLTTRALARIAASGLPGNVRQLEHLLASAWVLSDGPVLDADVFHELLGGPPVTPSASQPIDFEVDELPALGPPASQPATPPEPPAPRSETEWKALEHERILEALTAAGWNRVRAAAELGIPRRTFYRRLKEHGIL